MPLTPDIAMDISERSCYTDRMPRPTRSRAALAYAAAGENAAAAARALGCTVEELRAVLRIEETRGRKRRPEPSPMDARRILDGAATDGGREARVVGVRALARALDLPLSTVRGRLKAAVLSDGKSKNRQAARK